MTLAEIKEDIDKVLAFRNQEELPVSCEDFYYFEVLTNLFGNDGGYFREDDTLIFDLTIIGEGKIKTPFAELPYAYKTSIYEAIRDYIQDVETETGIKVSPQPKFIYDADKSNLEKRIFIWKINFDSTENKEQIFTTKELKEQKEDRDKVDERMDEKVEELKNDAEQIAIEQEKTKQKGIELEIEKEKTKQKDAELEMAKIRKQQDAMAMLQAGVIDLETFKRLIA
jgi:hypothetical protein